ncbi:helix-turn-helix domain-containing protein [Pseudomonas sp. PSE14]|uniref:winged helix-turn-helix transcriptional regulator n=1 Tax=Pseudomonas sp. PSE14 TaxID=3016341 RepID=UPI0023D88C5B|nr:helix-turn-helix domain-containing protein [Pseudomonas sp. PSE14]WEJ69840.1 helix-turn-helix domain-containing protein [Pseudomonas sp. PSE14]
MNDDSSSAPLMPLRRRPIMALLDLLGQKWALRILWELRGGALNSRALRAASGNISPTVLQSRVNELREAGIIASCRDGYSLTPLGTELSEVITPLYFFASKWADALDVTERAREGTNTDLAP